MKILNVVAIGAVTLGLAFPALAQTELTHRGPMPHWPLGRPGRAAFSGVLGGGTVGASGANGISGGGTGMAEHKSPTGGVYGNADAGLRGGGGETANANASAKTDANGAPNAARTARAAR